MTFEGSRRYKMGVGGVGVVGGGSQRDRGGGETQGEGFADHLTSGRTRKRRKGNLTISKDLNPDEKNM